MLYQLPNGRVIHLSVDQYLSLTAQDIRDLNSMPIGHYPSASTHVSEDFYKIKRKIKKDFADEGMDFIPDSDEVDYDSNIDINNIPDDGPDFTDI